MKVGDKVYWLPYLNSDNKSLRPVKLVAVVTYYGFTGVSVSLYGYPGSSQFDVSAMELRPFKEQPNVHS